MREFVFFQIESVQDDTDEKIENEQEAKDHEDDKEDDVSDLVVSLRRLMDRCGIDSQPHDLVPPFSSHHRKHSDHRVAYIIEVGIVNNPFTTIIIAVPL